MKNSNVRAAAMRKMRRTPGEERSVEELGIVFWLRRYSATGEDLEEARNEGIDRG
jgi:hypothetical protein